PRAFVRRPRPLVSTRFPCTTLFRSMEALKAITINAAWVSGLDDRVGSLEEGKDADVVIFDGHPLDVRSRTRMVFIDGKLVFERRSEEHTSELQSRENLVCRLLLEKT